MSPSTAMMGLVRIEDPIQQGLRLSDGIRNEEHLEVRIEDPIQQGLRHHRYDLYGQNKSQNRRSNTTRIKTWWHQERGTSGMGQNRRSNTTRIKTNCMFLFIIIFTVRIEDPIQQGLRPAWRFRTNKKTRVRIEDPIQQGLRPIAAEPRHAPSGVRIEDPIQQGLRPFYSSLQSTALGSE